jgi:FkbM family methyltransferase
MELFEHPEPALTRWIVASGYLKSAFVVIDVGCQGGEHVRWRWLGDHLEVHGFDALAEAIDELEAKNRGSRRKRYYNLGLGNEDGERELFIQENAYASSLYQQGTPRLAADASTYSNRERRVIPVRKLDSLFREGLVTSADFVKLDCEGFEPEVLRGAQEFLRTTRPLGVETETNFAVSPTLPRTHFMTTYDLLVEHRLLLHDLAFMRAACPSFVSSFGDAPAPATGRPATLNVLFARDLPAERDVPMQYLVPPLGETICSDTALKSAIMLELFGLSDCAYDTLFRLEDVLPPSFDLERAFHLLRRSAARDTLRDPVNALHVSTSWRMTAPMRAVVRWLRREAR